MENAEFFSVLPKRIRLWLFGACGGRLRCRDGPAWSLRGLGGKPSTADDWDLVALTRARHLLCNRVN